ncbi:MAG: Crp/Fnr family transcriptional regulator [Candidatus Zixiibacteriota bacterium]
MQKLLIDAVIFRELDSDEFKAMEDITQLRHVDGDAMLFFEGDPASGFFVLLSGRVRIYKSSPDGKEFTLHQITPGQVFAEAAIFRGNTYPANCMAMEDSEVAFIPKDQFIALITKYPNISLKIIGSLSRWLREFAAKLEDLSLKEVPARLATYLLRQRQKLKSDSFELDITKSELASELATISETLSRSLKKLKDLEVIAVEGKRITILDSDHLESIAAGEKI